MDRIQPTDLGESLRAEALLAHALVEAHQFDLVPLRIVKIERPPLHPAMLLYFNVQTERFEAPPLGLKIAERDCESDVIDGRVLWPNPDRSIEQAKHLRMAAVAIGDLQQNGRRELAEHVEAEQRGIRNVLRGRPGPPPG